MRTSKNRRLVRRRNRRRGSFIEHSLDWIRGWLLRLDVCRPDDRPPLLDLSPLEGTECLGRQLLARWNLLAHVDEPLTNCGIGERRHRRCIELSDEIPGRARGYEESMPEGDVESRQAGLVDGRNIGRRRPAGLRQD